MTTVYVTAWKSTMIALPNVIGIKFQAIIKGCGEQVEIEVYAKEFAINVSYRNAKTKEQILPHHIQYFRTK